jgi:hypothetical protein
MGVESPVRIVLFENDTQRFYLEKHPNGFSFVTAELLGGRIQPLLTKEEVKNIINKINAAIEDE